MGCFSTVSPDVMLLHQLSDMQQFVIPVLDAVNLHESHHL